MTLYHADGKKSFEGELDHGIPIGTWTKWYLSGEIVHQLNFNKGIAQSSYIQYHPNGSKAAQGSLMNNKRQGLWIEWHKNGQLKSKISYVNDQPEGNVIVYRDSGTIEKAVTYKNGKLNSDAYYWYENGQLKQHTYYQKDNDIIPWQTWYENGQLKSKTHYKPFKNPRIADTGHSSYTAFYENSQKKAQGNSINNSKTVLWTQWYANGQVKQKEHFKIKQIKRLGGMYDETVSEGLYEGYHKTGYKKAEGFTKDGEAIGLWHYWQPNGEKLADCVMIAKNECIP